VREAFSAAGLGTGLRPDGCVEAGGVWEYGVAESVAAATAPAWEGAATAALKIASACTQSRRVVETREASHMPDMAAPGWGQTYQLI
jgi:hypothetical protein